jgi:serine/threonine protein kinase
MVEKPLEAGYIIADRYRITHLMGSGALASVYKAVDTNTGIVCSVKVFGRDRVKSFPEYMDHLRWLNSTLSTYPNSVRVLEIGETEAYFYIAQEYLESVESLDRIIREYAPLHPYKALVIVREVSRALDSLHSASVIHADIKPSNLLISSEIHSGDPNVIEAFLKVYLIDFGMAKPIEPDKGLFLVGTPHYMSPQIRKEQIGPYIDIYALGVVGVEMLTRQNIPAPLSKGRLYTQLQEYNPWFSLQSELIRGELAGLLMSTLCVNAVDNSPSAKSIVQIAASLLVKVDREEREVKQPRESWAKPSDQAQGAASDSVFSQALSRLERIADSLSNTTDIFLSEDAHLKTVQVPQADADMLAEMSAVFTNALERSRNSWRITVGMTVISFILIVAMTTASVAMAITTGNSAWALIFGGASVSLILGTLIWRPFDRLFRATILSQQLEMIHVQTISGFRRTNDLGGRVQLCREAIASLQTLFNQHAAPESKVRPSRTKRSK